MDWVVKAPDGATLFGSHFLGDWDSCQKYWWLRHRAPHPEGGTGVIPHYAAKPLHIGGAMHDGLAYYLASGAGDGKYNLDEGMRGIAEKLVKNERNFQDKSEQHEVAVECQQLMEDYHEWYGPGGKRQDFPEMRVLVDSEGPVIEREYHLPLGDGFYFTCRVDAIVQYQDWLYVLEHKTSSPYRFSRLLTVMRTDSQGSGECAVLRHHFPDRKIQGVLLNVLVKGASRSKNAKVPQFARDAISRSDEQLKQFEWDVHRKLRLIQDRWGAYESLVADGETPWNAARHCFDLGGTSNGKCYEYRACEYMQLCSNLGKEELLVNASTFKPNRFPTTEATEEEDSDG
jgi:hypothetical protein